MYNETGKIASAINKFKLPRFDADEYNYVPSKGICLSSGREKTLYYPDGQDISYSFEQNRKYNLVDTYPYIASHIEARGDFWYYNYLLDTGGNLYRFGPRANFIYLDQPIEISYDPERIDERKYVFVSSGVGIDEEGHLWALGDDLFPLVESDDPEVSVKISNIQFKSITVYYKSQVHAYGIDVDGVIRKIVTAEDMPEIISYCPEMKWNYVYSDIYSWNAYYAVSEEGYLYKVGSDRANSLKLSEKRFIKMNRDLLCDEDHHWYRIYRDILYEIAGVWKEVFVVGFGSSSNQNMIFLDESGQLWSNENVSHDIFERIRQNSFAAGNRKFFVDKVITKILGYDYFGMNSDMTTKSVLGYETID